MDLYGFLWLERSDKEHNFRIYQYVVFDLRK